jgi:hypothetical protein
MAHIDSRRHRRRSHALDVANASVKGNVNKNYRRRKQADHKRRRAYEMRSLVNFKDFRCTYEIDCGCVACCDPKPLMNAQQSARCGNRYQNYDSMHDDLGPALRVAHKAAVDLQDFDAWFSYLKNYFPDTLAGRHALFHILLDARKIFHCTCCLEMVPWSLVDGNIRPCSCMSGNVAD